MHVSCRRVGRSLAIDDSVPYLFGTNGVEDGEVITSGVRKNTVTIGDTEEPEPLEYGSYDEFEDIWGTDLGL